MDDGSRTAGRRDLNGAGGCAFGAFSAPIHWNTHTYLNGYVPSMSDEIRIAFAKDGDTTTVIDKVIVQGQTITYTLGKPP